MTEKLIRNAYEAGLTMAAVLLAWAATLWLEGVAGLHTDAVVLAVALTVTLARTQRTADVRGRLTAFALLPAVAAVCALTGRLIAAHYALGAAVYTVAISLAIWIRRYGPAATRAGTLLTLPLVALLVVPGPALPSEAQGALVSWAWSALIGVLACGSVWLVQAVGDRYGPWPAGPEAEVRRRRASRLRPRPSTRMAVQMGWRSPWPSPSAGFSSTTTGRGRSSRRMSRRAATGAERTSCARESSGWSAPARARCWPPGWRLPGSPGGRR
ncbi:hypothetical protein GCM10010121_080300 [Streptomyces brasiliensis]|uniref:Uncharacterized protein n=1 Tax=Streptomyces brasiliensis TaxID=1954 RepID=A0A917LED1_9ACTN|nr:hypothetical protein GCM10010121_080300 [Streptomyces brasiliensis]